MTGSDGQPGAPDDVAAPGAAGVDGPDRQPPGATAGDPDTGAGATAADGGEGDRRPAGPGGDDGEVPGRRRGGRHRRHRRPLLWVAAGLAAVVAAFAAWFELEANPLGGTGAAVVVTVRSGEPVGAVIGDLARQGVIGSTLAFRLDELVRGTPSVLPGQYQFHQNMSFGAVRAILGGGPNVFSVDVVPGMSLREVAARVGDVPGHTAGAFLATAAGGSVTSPLATPGSHEVEGLLGTGSYRVVPGETDAHLLGQMVDRFGQQAAAAGLTPSSAQALGLSVDQVVTVASIVEKEGYIQPKNMGPVARVIYNRLALGMKLQMDSTVLYALGRDGGTVSAADLRVQSPYNTYLHPGLPPGPICSPSTTALRAALDAPPGGWLYFVLVQKDGTMAFSDTLAEQLANEKLARSRGVLP